MFEFFVRVQIREAVNEEDEDNARLRAAIGEVASLLAGFRWAALGSDRNTRGEVVHANGVPLIIAFGASNHERGTVSRLTELLETVARVAPGSHGFAWHIDYEQPNYSWVVQTLIRGEVATHKDPWFSPIIPTIEDEVEVSDAVLAREAEMMRRATRGADGILTMRFNPSDRTDD